MTGRRALTLAVALTLAACGTDDSSAAPCRPVEPIRIGTDAATPHDLAEVLPRPRIPEGDRPARAWGDLDGDGRDELLVDDDRSGLRVEPGGARVPEELLLIWHDDLDGRPGDDVVVPDPATGTTAVWSGRTVLAGNASLDRPDLRLPGLPRAVAVLGRGAERETLLLVPDPPAIRFVDPRRAELRMGGEPAREVEHIVVFDGADGRRRVGLRIDRRFAEWLVPQVCGSGGS